MSLVKAGEMAPDFEVQVLTAGVKRKFKLSDLRGKKNVVLAFHPLNWTPVCSQQMADYQAQLKKFAGYDAQVVGVSVDSIMSNTAWERKIGPLEYPLASDFYPHGEVARKYGVFRDSEPFAGVSERAIFVVDKNGRIVFSKVYDIGQLPDPEEAFEALRRLQAEAA